MTFRKSLQSQLNILNDNLILLSLFCLVGLCKQIYYSFSMMPLSLLI